MGESAGSFAVEFDDVFDTKGTQQLGMMTPPTELTASTATVNPALAIASVSTSGSASTESMCRRL